MIAKPKCPSCEARGKDSFALTDSRQQSKGGDPWFVIVHCARCGHVYAVFPKSVHPPSPELPEWRKEP